MNFKHLLAGALISLISFGVWAESEWKPIGTSNGFVIGVDANTIGKPSSNDALLANATHKVWVKTAVYEDLVQDGLSIGDYRMSLYLINCNFRALGIKSVTTYKKTKNGNFTNETGSVSYPKLEEAIPNSIGESVVDTVCSY